MIKKYMIITATLLALNTQAINKYAYYMAGKPYIPPHLRNKPTKPAAAQPQQPAQQATMPPIKKQGGTQPQQTQSDPQQHAMPQKNAATAQLDIKLHALIARFLNPQDTISWNLFCAHLIAITSQHEQLKPLATEISKIATIPSADQQTALTLLTILAQLKGAVFAALPEQTQKLIADQKDNLAFYFPLIVKRLQLNSQRSVQQGCASGHCG